MSDRQNPFAKPAAKTNTGLSSPRWGWITAGVLAVLAVVFFSLWASLRANQPDMDALRDKLNATTDSLTAAMAQGQKDQDAIASLKSQIDNLQQQLDQSTQSAKGLEDEMRNDLQSRDVTISKLQGKLTVNILDRVMFDSGEAVLKPGGAAVMQKIAAILAEHPELKIHVIGHTDNVPIRPEAHSRFASNWELSTARALAAVHYLTEQAGVDPRRVGAVGYGEYRPIADNSTPEGRARNRRIAITILPDELAGADVVPSDNGNAVTNTPPPASTDVPVPPNIGVPVPPTQQP
jgi:chemotaxis protein MotB